MCPAWTPLESVANGKKRPHADIGCSHDDIENRVQTLSSIFFLIAEEDRAACVLGLLGCLAGNQARDEGLGCSKLDKMVVLVLRLALSVHGH